MTKHLTAIMGPSATRPGRPARRLAMLAAGWLAGATSSGAAATQDPAPPPAGDSVVSAESPPVGLVPPPEALSDHVPASPPADPGGIAAFEDLSLDALLNEKVVTASGTAEERSMASANIQTFTAHEIALHGWRSIKDVLASVPGLYVIDDQVTPAVAVRGVTGGLRAGSRIVKMMIDGVEVNFRPDLTAFLGPEYIPIEAVERIEVAKGPLSARYGANAFLATVNVITSKGGSTGRSVSLRTNVSASGRAGGGVSGVVGSLQDRGGFTFAFSADQISRSGLAIEKTFASQNPEFARFRPLFAGESVQDRAQPVSLFGSAFLDGGSLGTLTLRGGMQQLDANGSFQVNSVLTDGSRHSLRNAWANVQHEKKWGAVDGFATVGASTGAPTRDDRQYLTGNDLYYFDRNFGYKALDLAAGLRGDFSGDRLGWSIKVDQIWEDHEVLHYTQTFLQPQLGRAPGDSVKLTSPEDLTQTTIRNFGVGVQLGGQPLASIDNLRVTADARLDLPSLYDAQYSWRGSVAYRWSPAVVTKAVVGRAFQTPSAVLMFGLPGFGTSANVVGTRNLADRPQLTPQTIHSAELVASANFNEVVAIEAAAFAQQIERRIEFVLFSRNFIASNEGTQRALGGEVTLHGRLGPLTPYVNGTALWDISKEMGQWAVRFRSPSMFPNATVLGGVRGTMPAWFLGGAVQARWIGPRGASQSNISINNDQRYELPSYATVDASLMTVGFRPFGGIETRFMLGAQNLLDTRQSEPGFDGFDLPTDGRRIHFELRQSF